MGSEQATLGDVAGDDEETGVEAVEGDDGPQYREGAFPGVWGSPGPWTCPTCGETTDKCYRCSECGKDLVDKNVAAARPTAVGD